MATGPIVTAGALMVNDQGRFLLGLRASWKSAWPDHWDIIGGHVEAGETPEAAMIREVQEEIGVTPTLFRWLACLPEGRPDLNGEGVHHIYLVTSWEGGEPRNICDEHSDLRWFLPEEMAAIPNLVDDSYCEIASSFEAIPHHGCHG